MTPTAPARSNAPAPPTPRWALWALGVAGVALVVLLLALALTGASRPAEAIGLAPPDGSTQWGLPIAKLIFDLSATVTVGFLLLAVLLPAPERELTADGQRAARLASFAAMVWALAAAAVHVLTLAELLGIRFWEVFKGRAFEIFIATVPQGRALAMVVILAATVSVAARLIVGHGGAVAVLLLAVATLIPPTFAGHTASGQFHHPAVVALMVHVVAVSLWVGGLVALTWYATRRGEALPRVARTYSAVALWCFVAVVASGVLGAIVRMTSPVDLLTTEYGGVLTFKMLCSGLLLWYGLRHRRRTLPELDAGQPGAFRRLAVGEAAVMGATVALAVTLTRTPPPVPDDVPPPTFAQALLGFTPPPELTVGRLVTEYYPDTVFALGCLAAVLMYGAGVLRFRRRGDRWPVGRTGSWVLGVLVVAITTLSGLMTYGMVVLSVHMTQHMLLSMVAPVLLVLGAPVTLALRAISPAVGAQRGAREMIVSAVHSRVLRVLTHPVVAWVLFVSAPFMTYFTSLFEFAMRHHTAHIAMQVHFLVVGYLFAEVLVGVDPLPKRPPYPLRVLMVLAALGFHAFFGVAFMNASNLIAGQWYRDLAGDIAWLPDPLADQRLAGGIAWGFGELPMVLILGVLFVQWYRSDEREARRHDRAPKATTELENYNAYLARLATRGKRRT
jgi:cytochrome c oxidase assembly factor CtaG/putative copper export protein